MVSITSRLKWIFPIAIIGVGLFIIGRAIADDPPRIKQTEQAGVLLVQTGWTSSADDVTVDKIKSQFCSGELTATKNAHSLARNIFQCLTESRISDVEDFYPHSKDRIILTLPSDSIPRMKHLKVNGINYFENREKYPLRVGNADAAYTHFILTGVSALTRYTGRSADANGVDVLTEKVKKFFTNADYVHVSNEVSFREPCEFAPGTRFCSKEAHFQAFKNLRVNVVELTGNHNRDFGDESFIKTFSWFEKNKMQVFGGGKNQEGANRPLYLSLKDGGKLGIIGFNELCPLNECADGKKPGANRYEDSKARADIESMRKAGATFIISTVQFGEVSSYVPRDSQRKISADLLNAGADLVYGSQAHQVQQMEFQNKKIILHGLGNFLFDQTHTFGLRQGYFMNLYFANGRLVSMNPVFTWIDEKFRPVPATEEQAAKIKSSIYLDENLYK